MFNLEFHGFLDKAVQIDGLVLERTIMNPHSTYCTFHVDQMLFGVEIVRVQEVRTAQQMTRVPLADSAVRGLMNLRGQIVTALELRCLLGLAERVETTPLMNVVIRTSNGPVSLLVDGVGDVLKLDSAQFEPQQGTPPGLPREVIAGVYQLQDGLLLVLDIETALNEAA